MTFPAPAGRRPRRRPSPLDWSVMAGTDGNNAFASFALAGGYVSAAVAVSPGEAPATREGKGGTNNGRVVRPRESASGEVEVMCKRCRDKRRKVQMEAGKDEGGAGAAARRAWLTAKQGSLTAFFGATANGAAGGEAEAATPAGGQDDGAQVCARCRAPIHERPPQRLAAKPREDPIVGKLKSYHRIATESGVKFAMTDGAAAAVMRNPCAFCGHIAPPGESNGLTRLRSVPSESGRGVMGDFSEANVDAACARCNFAKGSGRPQPFVGICRHIASHLHERAWTGAREALDAHEVPDDISDVSLFPAVLQRVFGEYGLLREKPPSAGTFGHFPELFRNDVGKKCRSSYLSDNKVRSSARMHWSEGPWRGDAQSDGVAELT